MTEMLDTFTRVEDKYFLTQTQADAVRKAIAEHVKEDAYFRYTVHSLYYDSIDSSLVIQSLNSPKYRMKLRERCYCQPDEDTPVFFETKKKLDTIVYKRRISMPYYEAVDYIEHGIPHSVHNNTADEIDYCMKYYGLCPKVLILYDRECWASIQEADVRITFDSNIRYRIDNVNMKEDGSEVLLNGNNEVVMEVKAMDRYPIWLVRILSKMKLYKGSYSKYGRIYCTNFADMAPHVSCPKEIEKTEKEKITCSAQF